MKGKYFIPYFLFVLIFSFSIACKKYPKNNLWLTTPSNVIAGDWKINYYLVDGIDSTNYPDISGYVNGVFTFSKGETQGTFGARDQRGILSLSEYLGSSGGLGNWSLDHKKKNIRLGVGLIGSPTLGLQKDIFRATGYWKIERLDKKEFWISNAIGDVVFEIRFKK